jgi:hypothetical protein
MNKHMSIPAAQNPTSWQSQYTAEESRWQDLRRAGGIITPIALLLIVPVLAAIGYTYLHIATWMVSSNTLLAKYWFIFRLCFTFLLPLLFSIGLIVLLYQVVIKFIKTYHNHPDAKKIGSMLQRKMIGVPPLPPPLSSFLKYPFVIAKEPKDIPEDHWTRWMGGPATLVIYDGTALYLERGNRFSRVVGPGKPPMPFLERFETVKAAVDLRPQVRVGETKPWTKDGIQVKLNIRMECQINASEEARKSSADFVNPFDPIAVKQAVEYTTVKLNPETQELFESDWLDGVWGRVTGYLARHVTCYSADELALAELEEVGPSAGHMYSFGNTQKQIKEINADLTQRNCGAHLLNLQVSIKFPDEVENQRIDYWKSKRNKLATIQDSKTEADGIRAREEAHARAERDMLNAITERLQRVDRNNLTEPLLLSLTGILDNSLDDPLVRSFIAKQSLDLLERLRKVLEKKF